LLGFRCCSSLKPSSSVRKSYTSLKVYGYAYLSFLIWNVGATWWVVNASFEGALMAFLANSALMAGVFTLGI
jgi:apolipoprotein N-acyltransferase